MKKRKWLASLLAVVMVLAMMPTMAFAAGDTVEVSNGMTFTSDTTQSDIDTWANSAAIITNNTDGTYTVTLQKNITLQQGATSPITFGNYWDAAGAKQPTMILDLNGFTVSGKTIVISNMGNLIIRDSKGTGKVVYDGGKYLAAVQNAGYSLTIEGGTFECNGANSAAYNAAISAAASTKTVVNGGVFDGNGAGALIAYGDVIVNSGTFNAPNVVGKIGNVTPQDQVVIAGGSYTADPSAFVADNTALIGLTNNGTTQYAAGGDAQIMADSAKEGDTITVLQGDKITVPDKVTVKNQTGSEITVNGETVQNGAEIEAHVHNYSTEWKFDDTNHWYECSCGDKTDIAAHTFKWITDEEATATEAGSKHEECTVCGYAKAAVEIPATGTTEQPTKPSTDAPQTGDNSNMIVWVAVMLMAGAGMAGTIVYSRKRKHSR